MSTMSDYSSNAEALEKELFSVIDSTPLRRKKAPAHDEALLHSLSKISLSESTKENHRTMCRTPAPTDVKKRPAPSPAYSPSGASHLPFDRAHTKSLFSSTSHHNLNLHHHRERRDFIAKKANVQASPRIRRSNIRFVCHTPRGKLGATVAGSNVPPKTPPRLPLLPKDELVALCPPVGRIIVEDDHLSPISKTDSDISSDPSKSFSRSASPPLASPEETLVGLVEEETSIEPKQRTSRSKTFMICPSMCLDHHNGDHQENRERLLQLSKIFQHSARFQTPALEWISNDAVPPAKLCDILRVHSHAYLEHLEAKCTSLNKTAEEQRLKCGGAFEASGRLDFDTLVSSKSFDAARRAAGSVCFAVDKIMNSSRETPAREISNVFVAIRPPGHHAGPHGCVPGPEFHSHPSNCSSGFCLFNNVAIGAAYAMSRYGSNYFASSRDKNEQLPEISRVAIIDFDIHHGNGTEAIVRNLVPHQELLPLPESWAPRAFASFRPWRDERDLENVFLGSVHLYNDDDENQTPTFYPMSGRGPHGDAPELATRVNVVNVTLEPIGPACVDARERLSMKSRRALVKQASEDFREAVSQRLLPALRAFDADLIFLSAGFDGHADDFYYFLTEDDYHWITSEVVAIADACCQGRVISVLEGGYNCVSKSQDGRSTSKPSKGKSRHHSKSNFVLGSELHQRPIEPEDEQYGSLARSCAAHVEALMHI